MLEELKLAARMGFFVVADRQLGEPCMRRGRVLRFDPRAEEAALRAAVVRSLTSAFPPISVIHTLTY